MIKNNYKKLILSVILALIFTVFTNTVSASFSGVQTTGSITPDGMMTIPHTYVSCNGTELVHLGIFIIVSESQTDMTQAFYDNVACGSDEGGNPIAGKAGFNQFVTPWSMELAFQPFNGVKNPPVNFGMFYFRDNLGCTWGNSTCNANTAVAGNFIVNRNSTGVWTLVSGSSESCFDGILNQNETAIDIGGVCVYPYSQLSRINGVEPIQNSTVGLNYNLKYQFYLNTLTDSDLTRSVAVVCPLSYELKDCKIFDGEIPLENKNILSSNTQQINTTELFDGKNGTYEVTISLWNGLYDKTCKWYQPFCTPTKSREIEGNNFTYTVGSASGTNGIPEAVNKATFYEDKTCAVTDIVCGFKNAFKSIFNESYNFITGETGNVTASFYNSIPNDLIKLKFFPFSLFSDIQDAMTQGLEETNRTDTTGNSQYQVSILVLGTNMKIFDMSNTQNLMGSNATNLIKSLLSMILWLMFFTMIYYQIMDEAIRLSHGGKTI